MSKNLLTRFIALAAALAAAAALLTSCENSGVKAELDPKNPVTISVWHYYNGAIINAFSALVKEFNETVGAKEGIIVEGFGMGNVSELERAVISSANKEVGSQKMPNVFASYADTAYIAEKMGLLANLDDYLSGDEQNEYFAAYLEEGKIGIGGELRIFPIAKSTEILMVNETDWLPFAGENNLSYDDLSTMEGMARVAKLYYEWTDAKTPEESDGKAFFGRDSMANLFIIASKQFGTEIFKVSGGKAELDVNEDVMRHIWDYYYVPYISGYYTAYGRYRSDDAKVGDILAYVGSTSSAAYFPAEVTTGGRVYPVEAKVLPAPIFEGAENVMVQQGAGMVVTKSNVREEYASVVFLKWFTETEQNIKFSAMSGYMPVKKESNNYESISRELSSGEYPLDDITSRTLQTALETMSVSELYTNKAFDGGAAARSVLEYSLQDKAVADRAAVHALLLSGKTLEDSVAAFNTDENFYSWLEQFVSELSEAAG